MTYRLAMACGQDAGTRHMRANGRTVWAAADFHEAYRVFTQLWPQHDVLELMAAAEETA